MSPSLQNNFIASILLIFVFCAAQGLSQTLNDDAFLAEKHEQWMGQYGRTYKDIADKEKRFNIFKENLKYIENFNKAGNNRTYKLSANKFADLTHEEFVALYTIKNIPTTSSPTKRSFKYQNLTDAPATSMSWVDKGAVTKGIGVDGLDCDRRGHWHGYRSSKRGGGRRRRGHDCKTR
ncbi:xylem cysteine proteinase 1-like [Tripterygium wilfordii]|uniref:Xylem cysteine proteinase 1-like n=1 Tax=Tripterygium wilfordii TaxID=458696 RepID=A0A7J7CJL3_TRIWF|nr:xylem cysteine proteinase 1-like [Tripterygium wilfordii]